MNRKGIKHQIESLLGYSINKTKFLPRGIDLKEDLIRFHSHEPISVIFDVGGNKGQSVSRFHAMYPMARIYSFEPVASNYEMLRANVGQLPNVELHRVGMSDRAGTAEINVNEYSGTCSLEFATEKHDVESIPLTMIDSFCDEHRISRIGLLKIDVEGHERQVLRGAAKMLGEGRVDFIFVEGEIVSSPRHFVPLAEYLEMLAPYGYSLSAIYDQTANRNSPSALRYANFLFARGETGCGDAG